jgi:AraC family ethanolamine operon transcriptional activator
MRYLKISRLHAARENLRMARTPEITVKRTAMDLGFWDLGRFASDYRKLFGERPSETLARARGMKVPTNVELC